jgi:hypothetical protein
MTSRATISPQEAADRLAIRELIDAYAHCADRRDAKGQMALFTADTRFIGTRGPHRRRAVRRQRAETDGEVVPVIAGRSAGACPFRPPFRGVLHDAKRTSAAVLPS